MTRRRRRRAVRAETIAPWAALSFILLFWWVGAKALNWAKSDPPSLQSSGEVERERAASVQSPVDTTPDVAVIEPAEAGPTISADTSMSDADLSNLRSRHLLIPVKGLDPDDLVSSFHDSRGRRSHEAIDMLAPRGTDVLAVEDGKVAKLFTSDAGGLTLYQFDPSDKFVYYYAHLDAYAPDVKEGTVLKRGDVIGYVGTTGNAPEGTPHLHFAISKLDPDRRWWGGSALDPFLVWRRAHAN